MNKHCGNSYEDIKEFIENNNCKLITVKEEYKNYKTKIKIICKCGNEFITDFNTFLYRNKRQCNTCGQKRAINDLVGKKFGYLTVIKLDIEKMLEYKNKNKNQNKAFWLCKCDCGNLKSIMRHSLISGKVKSCGCICKLNLEGKKFNKLTVLNYAYTKNNNIYWNCLCDCGNNTILQGTYIKNNKIKSCGCLNIEANLKHGLSHHPLYRVFTGMKQRCYNSNFESYKYYGHKGVIICDEWLNNFEVFYNWAINNGYEKGLEIDRIDYNGNYEPYNCRWVDDLQQANNTSSNLRITIGEETKNLSEWCRFYNKKDSTVRQRIRAGWDIIKALNTKTDGKQNFKKDLMIEFNGEYKMLKEWCILYNIKYATLKYRLNYGMDLKIALTTPVIKGRHFNGKYL